MGDFRRDYQLGRLFYRCDAVSELGLLRKNNEDALALLPEQGIFGVCDGLGGHAGGEVASSLAAEEFLKTIDNLGAENPGETLTQALNKANRRIIEEQSRDRALVGMGTTLSAIWFASGDSQAALAHLGDSRIYRYAGGALEQLSEDHSPVFELFKRGFISKAEMQRHPQKSLIDKCLGIYPAIDPQIALFKLQAGDRFLIATDGLTDNMSDDLISWTLAECAFEGALARMIEEVYRAGAPDNISAVLVEITKIVD